MAARDYAFEALADSTGTDWKTGRGELNAALKSIREQSPVTDSYLLAAEIHEHAKLYRDVMGPDVVLTPSALAKHWKRVTAETAERSKVKGTNLHSTSECTTCDGDRFVVVSLRKPQASAWMNEHGIKPHPTEMIEEMAPCPDCGAEIKGTPDPAKVREMLKR